jgi:hypothetical protein
MPVLHRSQIDPLSDVCPCWHKNTSHPPATETQLCNAFTQHNVEPPYPQCSVTACLPTSDPAYQVNHLFLGLLPGERMVVRVDLIQVATQKPTQGTRTRHLYENERNR